MIVMFPEGDWVDDYIEYDERFTNGIGILY